MTNYLLCATLIIEFACKKIPCWHADEDGTESVSTMTPRDSTEMDDTDQEKHLLSAREAAGEVAFIKEPEKNWT